MISPEFFWLVLGLFFSLGGVCVLWGKRQYARGLKSAQDAGERLDYMALSMGIIRKFGERDDALRARCDAHIRMSPVASQASIRQAIDDLRPVYMTTEEFFDAIDPRGPRAH